MMRAPYETDDGFGGRARFGVVVLQGDETLEMELPRLVNFPGVATHITRIAMADEVTVETLSAMTDHLHRSVALLPASPLSVVAYACTSGATIIGSAAIAQAIGEVRRQDTPATTDPLTAILAACQALSIRHLGCLMPYVGDVSEVMCGELEKAGIAIQSFASFEQASDNIVAHITPASVYEAALQVGRAGACDGLFIACTNVRTLDIIPAVEGALGIPVLSSNQALAWHMLRTAGVDDTRDTAGALFRV